MSIALTCKCSAQLEFDDAFAGKTIPCPDCDVLLTIPMVQVDPRKTSVLALLSLTAALLGAFTIFGTLIAIALGVYALFEIQKRPNELAGKDFAVAGIVLAGIMTVLTIVLLFVPGLFRLDSTLQRLQWAGKLKYWPAEEGLPRIPGEGWTMQLPGSNWGALLHAKDAYQLIDARSYVLVEPSIPAYLFVLSAPGYKQDIGEHVTAAQGILEKFQVSPSGTKWPDETIPSNKPLSPGKTLAPFSGGYEVLDDMVIKKQHGFREYTYLVKLFKTQDGRLFIVAGGLPTKMYQNKAKRAEWDKLKDKIEAAVDSFKPDLTATENKDL